MHRSIRRLLRRPFTRVISSDLVQFSLARAQFWTDAFWTHSPQGESARSNALSLREYLRPWKANYPNLVRVGNSGDGGYVMATNWENVSGAISIGIGSEDSWDRCVAQAGVPVWQFDHTILSSPTRHSLVQWSPIGVGPGSGGENQSLRSLDELIQMTGITGDRLILKMDVEGAEWTALAGQDLQCFEQILVELHGLDLQVRPRKWPQTANALSTLTRSHVVVHVHANNCCGIANVAGVVIPRVLEVTLIRRDLLQEIAPERSVGPTSLDFPNVPNRREVWYPSFWDAAVGGTQ